MSAVAHSAGSIVNAYLDPGACAPGFVLAPAVAGSNQSARINRKKCNEATWAYVLYMVPVSSAQNF